MSSELQSGKSLRRVETPSRWAPWWVYVIVIAPVNMGKEQLLPREVDWPFRVMLTSAIVAAGIAVVTALYRVSRDVGGSRSR